MNSFSMTIISREEIFVCGHSKEKFKAMGFSATQEHLFSYLNLKKVISLESMLEILEETLSTLGLDGSSLNEKLAKEIAEMNKIIQKYDLEIVELTDEVTCEKLIILINTGIDRMQKSMFYNANTVHFFSKIIEECVLSEEGFLSETHCLNLNSQVKITKLDAQCILEKLIKDKWLVTRDDKISLGTRSIAELEQSIKQHYPNDVKNCLFCKLIVLQGYICHNCKNKSHYACWKKYSALSKKNPSCPSCKKLWNNVPSNLKLEDSEQERDTTTIRNPRKKKKSSTLE